MEPLAVVMARQVIALYECNLELYERVAQLEGYKKKYEEEVQRGTRHSQVMMNNMMDILLKPGVPEALLGEQK